MNKTIDRTIAPPLMIQESLNVLMPIEREISNGTKLYSLAVSDHDVVRLSLVFRAGTRYQSQPFQASTVVTMISEGSAKHTAAELAEKMDFYGSHFDTNIDRDYSVVTICALSKFLQPTLELLEDMLLNPIYDSSELETYAAKRKQQLIVERQKPSYRARELFAAALFGENHPYGSSYDQSHYDALNAECLHDFHKTYYTAENCFAVCSGNVTDADLDLIARFVEKIPNRESLCASNVVPDSVTTPQIFENREGAVQSAIRIGKLMFPREHPDFSGMQVLCTVLGGYFGSRLVSNLREDKGFTYGIFSMMVNMEHGGYMAIATEVGAEFTQEAISEIFVEMAKLQQELVSEEELQAVKNIMTGELMRILDGPFGIADVTMENIQNSADNSYVTQFFDEIQRITPQRIRQLAQKYLDKEDFTTVVVGKI